MAANVTADWQELCKMASAEQDPKRLIEILHEINLALVDQRTRAADFRDVWPD